MGPSLVGARCDSRGVTSTPAPSIPGLPPGAGRPTVFYREHLSPPLWWGLPVAGMVASVAAALAAALGPGAAALGALITALIGVAGGVGLSRARLEVRQDGIRVDRVVLPWAILTGARALGPAEAGRLRGQGYDPRGWYRLRGWIPGAVLFTVADPDDPTPFWYVSSRTPELAVAAVAAAAAAEDRSVAA